MPVANATSHQCVNWDQLAGWTHDRAVDMMKPGWLMHPTRGMLQQFLCFLPYHDCCRVIESNRITPS